MAGKRRAGNPVPVNDVAAALLDPLMRRRAGISVELVQSWEGIVGERLAGRTRPERIAWPRRRHEDEPFDPATLVVACDGMAALRLQHETAEIISRVNAFLGFAAIGRIRIVQKSVEDAGKRTRPDMRPLTAPEEERLSGMTGQIEDEDLRASLMRLGASVVGSRKH